MFRNRFSPYGFQKLFIVRNTGIEPTSERWRRPILPLNESRITSYNSPATGRPNSDVLLCEASKGVVYLKKVYTKAFIVFVSFHYFNNCNLSIGTY